jgi:hypothetical protein
MSYKLPGYFRELGPGDLLTAGKEAGEPAALYWGRADACAGYQALCSGTAPAGYFPAQAPQDQVLAVEQALTSLTKEGRDYSHVTFYAVWLHRLPKSPPSAW